MRKIILTSAALLAANMFFPQQSFAQSCSAADFNGDGRVSDADRQILLDNFFTTNSRYAIAEGDYVDADDYRALVSVYGQSCGNSSSSPDSGSGGTNISDNSRPSGAPSNAVVIQPREGYEVSGYLNDILKDHPAGTTFYLKKGMYRIDDYLRIQAGDTIIGEKGAIISGANQLETSKVKRDGNLYYFENQNQDSEPKPNSKYRGQLCDDPNNCSVSATGYSCLAEAPRCNYNEELFINDKVLRHVDSKSKVTSGTFYFDYGANRIYMADNPAGKKIEVSTTLNMLNYSGEKNVRISNLIVEKFATQAQRAAVENYGDGSIVEFTEIRWNHATGGGVGSNGIFRNNYVHHNGQKGLGSKTNSVNARFENNEVSYNNLGGFDPGWESGGSKWAYTKGTVVKNNYSHHNEGSGFWTDIDNEDCVYDGNILVHNTKHGIQHEISFDCEIKNNFAAYNGRNQIFIQNSSGFSSNGIRVYNNTIIVGPESDAGITAQTENRGFSTKYPEGRCSSSNRSGTCTPWTTRNVLIENNDVYYLKDSAGRQHFIAGLYGRDRSSQFPDPFNFQTSAKGVTFRGNQYYLKDANLKAWSWGPYWTSKSYNEFKAETGETKSIRTSFSTPSFTWNVNRGPQ